MRPVAVALAALALAAPAAAAARPPAHGRLVIGRSLGGVRLGASLAALLKAWGSSFGICRNCTSPTWYFTYRSFQPQGVGVTFQNGRVTQLFTVWSPPGWHATGGVAIGDPVGKVAAVYKALARTDCAGYYALTLRRARAETVFYIRDETVWGFGLSRPGSPRCR